MSLDICPNEANYYGHIAIVDDDSCIAELLSVYLEQNGYIVNIGQSISDLCDMMKVFVFDAIILDIMMPHCRGDDFLRASRSTIQSPVILLSALGDVDDRVSGLEIGADEYIAKPFDTKELLLRMQRLISTRTQKLIEKPNKPSNAVIKFENFLFFLDSGALTREGQEIYLTSTERTLMQMFGENIGIPLERQVLVRMLRDVNERTIDTQIARLRAKIEVNPKKPHNLRTVRNTGYLLNALRVTN